MTTKDIRDIAAYWGATYSARVMIDMRYEQFKQRKDVVDADLMRDLPSDMLIWWDFKLHLRRLSSLTDEEISGLLSEVGLEIDSFDREETCIWFHSYETYGEDCSLDFDTGYLQYQGSVREGGNSELVDPYRVCAYLQSIGVYVPGAISEEFVQLID